VKNQSRGGKVALKVNGNPIEGHLVPYAPAGATVDVECDA
jgi:hypothetical protein